MRKHCAKASGGIFFRFELKAAHPVESLAASGRSRSPLGLLRSVATGGLGFGAVSVAAFAVWALAGRWLTSRAGEAGLYVACATVFIGLSGLALRGLTPGPGWWLRFYRVFIPAFTGYAIIWSAAWFLFGFGSGEWIGSLAGSVLFTIITARGFGSFRSLSKACLVVFILHSAGYFLGELLTGWLPGPAGRSLFAGLSKAQIYTLAKLAWGLCYGLGFGAGLGFAFHTFQNGGAATTSEPGPGPLS